MGKVILLLLLILSITFLSCTNTTKIEDDEISTENSKTVDSDDDDGEATSEEEVNEPQLLNGIKISSSKDVKVYRASLHFEDGTLVPKSNKVQPGQKVKLMLNIEKGWMETDGMVSLGASEKAETNTGVVLLDAEDLFASRTEMRADDGKMITLSITLPKPEAQYDYYTISFRVWDKRGNGEVKGSYRLFLEE